MKKNENQHFGFLLAEEGAFPVFPLVGLSDRMMMEVDYFAPRKLVDFNRTFARNSRTKVVTPSLRRGSPFWGNRTATRKRDEEEDRARALLQLPKSCCSLCAVTFKNLKSKIHRLLRVHHSFDKEKRRHDVTRPGGGGRTPMLKRPHERRRVSSSRPSHKTIHSTPKSTPSPAAAATP